MKNTNNTNLTSTPNKVYGYIRVSTETQADKGYGLDTQTNAIQEYCNKNNLILSDIFVDAGKSGVLGDKKDMSYREGLTNLLAAIEKKDTVIVMNTSRLWRDDSSKVFIIRAFRPLKVNLISIEQSHYSLYSKDPNEYLINSIMEILDQYDRMCINVKLAKGQLTKAHKGYKPSGVTPYGYKWSYDRKSIEIDPNEAEVIKTIFNFAASYTGLTDIASYLNEHNYKTRKGNPWTKQSISVILNNKFYIGIVTYKEEIKGEHKPIISKTLWDKAQMRNDKAAKQLYEGCQKIMMDTFNKAIDSLELKV